MVCKGATLGTGMYRVSVLVYRGCYRRPRFFLGARPYRMGVLGDEIFKCSFRAFLGQKVSSHDPLRASFRERCPFSRLPVIQLGFRRFRLVSNWIEDFSLHTRSLHSVFFKRYYHGGCPSQAGCFFAFDIFHHNIHPQKTSPSFQTTQLPTPDLFPLDFSRLSIIGWGPQAFR